MPLRTLIVNRKSLIVFAVLLSLITLHFTLTFAATPLDTAQSDYNFQFSKYQEFQEKFISAKSNYQTFKTATAKDQAFTASRGYVNQAINVYLAYFSLVQEYGNSLNWQGVSTFSNVTQTINDIKNTYLQARQTVSTSQTLEDVDKNASDLAIAQTTAIDPRLYWILSVYELQKTFNLMDDFNSFAEMLSQKESNFARSNILSSWQTDVETIRKNAQTQLNIASTKINATNGKAEEGTLKETISRTQNARNEILKSKKLFFEAAKLF